MLNEMLIDDDLFLIDGIKNFIKEYKKEVINTNEKIYFKKYYDLKRNTRDYIDKKRIEYENEILFLENKVSLLNKTFKELNVEKDIRDKEMRLNSDDYLYKEKLDDIIDAINENKRIIVYENIKIDDLKNDYYNFNKASMEDEMEVKTFFKYIKREFLREKKRVIGLLHSNELDEIELILNYEYILLMTKKIISIQEELIGG